MIFNLINTVNLLYVFIMHKWESDRILLDKEKEVLNT